MPFNLNNKKISLKTPVKHLLSTFFLFLFITSLLTAKALAADTTPPVTGYTKNPPNPDGNWGWYVSPVTFQLTATDLESGVKEINYRVDGGSWIKEEYEDSLNLAPNPSLETIDNNNTPKIQDWTATVQDVDTTYLRDTGNYAPGFSTTSAKITTTGIGWHGINNSSNFAAATPLNNMSASAMIKTENVLNSAYFKVYAVSLDGFGQPVYTLLGQSNSITATTDWIQISSNFVVSVVDAIGVYLDIGLDDGGTLWVDAITISESLTSQNVTFVVGSDNEDHTVEYYSVDRAGNTETHNCSAGINCVEFKIDQTPPGNWHGSGASRGLFGLGAEYNLWVYTNVDDPTSGLSTFTDKYMIKTELHPEFGKYSQIWNCGSSWQPGQWLFLITPPFLPGVKSVYLITPKTSFCNADWHICKYVRFYARDMAGNEATKDFCINGPWISVDGEGIVRGEGGIDMLSEAEDDNTDGLIESGTDEIDYFSSSKDWELYEAPVPAEYNYDTLWGYASESKDEITGSLPTNNGVYYVNSDYTLNDSTIPGNYSSEDFSQVIFIDGDLTIDKDLIINEDSAVLFIVNGNTQIEKTVVEVNAAIFSENDFNTAYNIAEGDITETLILKGVFTADTFTFYRTLQGTDNKDYPSEAFTYEPKYLLKLKDYLGINSIRWLQTK